MDLAALAEEKYSCLCGCRRLIHITMRDIVRDFCEVLDKPYAIVLHPNGIPMDAFVTHCWSEPFLDFGACAFGLDHSHFGTNETRS